MSRNSKNRRKLATAQSFSAIRKNGGKGPTRTEKKHTKRNVWYRTGDRGVASTRSIVDVPVEQLVASQPQEAAA